MSSGIFDVVDNVVVGVDNDDVDVVKVGVVNKIVGVGVIVVDVVDDIVIVDVVGVL